MERAWNKIKVFTDLIKFEHTVFALPFAYLGWLLASAGRLDWGVLFWVTLAMAGARTAAMTLNRLVDLKLDALNPRTRNRPLATGQFPMPAAWAAVAVSLGVLFLSAWRLNPLCLKLAPAAVVLLCVYHYVKRFSWLCHFVLGLVLSAAPIGGWIAVTGQWAWSPVLLSLAVLFWVAGFDILYSLQDADFDRTHGLHSIPVSFGTARALSYSAFCHIATLVFLTAAGVAFGLGWVYWAGAAVCAGLLMLEHRLINEQDLSRLGTAFFTINGWIGVLLLVFTFLETFK